MSDLASELRDATPEALVSILPQLLAAVGVALAAIVARAPSVPQAPPADDLLSVAEAAQLLNVSTDFCYRSASLRECRAKLGTRTVFSRKKLAAHVQRKLGR